MQNFTKIFDVDYENKKSKVFGPIWHKIVTFWGKKEFLSKYSILSTLLAYSFISLCEISKISLEWIARKRCTRF